MGVAADRSACGFRFSQPAGIDLEGSAQIRLAGEIEINGVESRRRLRWYSGLRSGDGSARRPKQNAD